MFWWLRADPVFQYELPGENDNALQVLYDNL